MTRPMGRGALWGSWGVLLGVCAGMVLGPGVAQGAELKGRVAAEPGQEGPLAGVGGVAVGLYECSGRPPVLRRVVLTEADGAVTFGALPAGMWAAQVVAPVGWAAQMEEGEPPVGATGSGWSPCHALSAGASGSFEAVLRVDNSPPDCRDARADVTRLDPADGRFVHVSVVGVRDPDGDAVTVQIGAIYQDEALGQGPDPAPDAVRLGGRLTALRAAREPAGDGRVYHVRFTAGDGRGGACRGEVVVHVPLDPSAEVVDGGAQHDATQRWDRRWGPAPVAPEQAGDEPALAVRAE